MKVNSGRRPVVERLVGTLGVVKLKVLGQSGVGLANRSVGFQVYIFVFDRSPESFGKDVVHAPSASVHANFDIPVEERLNELLRGKV